jgi:hypothetical protein
VSRLRGLLILAFSLLVPATTAQAQAGVSYGIPPDNPFVGSAASGSG